MSEYWGLDKVYRLDKMIIGWYDPRHMKKQIVIATLLTLLSVAPASAETVRTCSSVYGGGEVCGETTTTTTTVTHDIVKTDTGVNDNEMFKLLGSFALAALVATGLYKLTYKSYILG